MASSTPSLNYNQMDRFKKRKIRIIKIIIKINFNRVAEQHPVFQSTRESRRKSFSVKTKNSASARTCFPISFIHIYIYIPSHNYLAIKKNVRSFSNGEKEDRATSRSKEMEEDQANSEIRYFSVPSRKGGARATGRAAASLPRLEGEESGGRGERRRSGRIDEKSCAVARA